MKNSICVFLMCICPALGFAQVPGYQGKRLSVEGDLYCFSALLHPNENLQHGIKSFNQRYHVNLEYITSKNTSVGLTYGMLNTGWRNHVDRYGYVSHGYDIFESYTDYYKIQSKFMGMYLKFFREEKGTIAPYGPYQKVGISYVMSEATYQYSEDTIRGNPATSGNMIMFSYGFGKQSIFFNRLILRYGIETALSPTIFTWLAKEMDKDGSVVNSKGETEGMTLNERLLWGNIININVGIGLILF
jgi:hypothetical protein